MNKIYLLVLITVLLSCATNPSRSRNFKRSPASTESLNAEKIITFARKLLRLQHEEIATRFRVAHFPVNGPADIKPDGLETAFANVFKEFGDDYYWSLSYEGVDTEETEAKRKEEYKSILMSSLNREERDSLLSLCFKNPTHVGDVFNMAATLASNFCQYAGLIHSEEELLEVLINFPAQPKGVRYDGQVGYHVYENQSLKKSVEMLTAAVNTDRMHFYKLFHNQPDSIKNKFRTNSNGAAEWEKVEPFDLIATLTVAFIMGKNLGVSDSETELNKIQISKLAQKAIARLFLMVEKKYDMINSVPSLTVAKGENAVEVICANGMFPVRKIQHSDDQLWFRGQAGTDLIEFWRPSYNLHQFTANGFSASNLTCNTIEYRFDFTKIPADKIPAPQPLSFPQGEPINALMTVSLVSEIDRTAVDQAKQLVGILTGWKLVGDIESVNTREFLKTELTQADAYFPVMHAMDVNYFNIGTEQGLVLRLSKDVTDSHNQKRTLNLAILLPDGSKSLASVVMKPDELAQLLDERYRTKPTSLFLMNNSCASEKTLFAWTLVFRKALELRKKRGEISSIAAVADFPHIIGSKRYFGTASVMEIFSHADYPLRSLEMLGQGKSVTEIVEYLKAPAGQGFLDGLGSLFGGSKVQEEGSDEGFAPVYVLDYPELLSLGGIRISVTSRAIKGKDEY